MYNLSTATTLVKILECASLFLSYFPHFPPVQCQVALKIDHVLCSANDACSLVGVERLISPRELLNMRLEILEKKYTKVEIRAGVYFVILYLIYANEKSERILLVLLFSRMYSLCVCALTVLLSFDYQTPRREGDKPVEN